MSESVDRNKLPTILPLREDLISENAMGQRDGLSKTDVVRLNAYYGCQEDCKDEETEICKWHQRHNQCNAVWKFCRRTCGRCKHQKRVVANMPNKYGLNKKVTKSVPSDLKLFEGDIDLGGKPLSFYLRGRPPIDPRVQASAARNVGLKWTSGIVPYTLSSNYSASDRKAIDKAIKYIQSYTCVKFVPRTNQKNYIDIKKRGACYSALGMRGGSQPLSLADHCLDQGIILHEFMHALGFFHEHNRNDRDDHIVVIWRNFEHRCDSKLWFKKIKLPHIDHLKTPYDYDSIMHYGNTTYSRYYDDM